MPNILATKSDQTWDEGTDCLYRGQVNTAANRIYYAVFQAVKGFAIQRGDMTIESREGVHRKALEIVRGEGGRGNYYRRILNELFSLRVTADYMPESVEKKELEDLLTEADSIRKHYIRIAGGAG